MSKRKPDSVSGVLIIDKHAGVTSHRIISACRRLFDTGRVGHTGTLDPMATGVLPILLGRAVKASEYLIVHDKAYRAEMQLGIVTDTEDVTGEILGTSAAIPDEETVRRVCASFTGRILQVPPMYSAVKIGGRKLVDIAREGGEVERAPREVEIYSLTAEKLADDRYALDVACSKGTYIRTLCADIGRALGCGAAMAALRRTRTGRFTLDDAVTVEALEGMTFEERAAKLLPVETLFEDLGMVEVNDFYAKLTRGGADLFQKKLHVDFAPGTLVRVRHGGQFIALARAMEKDGVPILRAEKLFVIDEGKKAGETAEEEENA
ncbi:MAG: tRNA pseudouridine(55) synthase TruB [Clostridia bacterium]|nr:tRNA pseudouridine(55) synthase TruB [Clostridia bacterium]